MWITVIIALVVMWIVGAVFGVSLSLFDRWLKVYQDPLIEKIVAELPGINCGACGEIGCISFAKAVIKNRAMGQGCLPGGAEVNAKIAAMLGLDSQGNERLKVVCKCLAKCSDQKKSFDYRGPQSCGVAHGIGGSIDCQFGCLGLGDCVRVCPTGALAVVDGHVEVDHEKCIDCGLCVKSCPRSLFKFARIGTAKNFYVVGCNNPESGLETKKVCTAGCIGCGICARIIPDSPILLEWKVARIDYGKARGVNLDAAVAKCPAKIIRSFTA
jgi:electron transport complex protein RnfB